MKSYQLQKAKLLLDQNYRIIQMTQTLPSFNLEDFIVSCEASLNARSVKYQQQQIINLFYSVLDSATKRQAVIADLKKYAKDKFPSQQGAYIIKQSDQLFLSIFTLPAKMRTAIHNHGLWTTVAILQGSSQCQFYNDRQNLGIQKTSSELLAEGAVYTISAQQPHDVFNPNDESTIELHFYPGNVMAPEIDAIRSLWHPFTLAKEPYTLERSVEISKAVSLGNKVLDSVINTEGIDIRQK